MITNCYCNSNQIFSKCCSPYIDTLKKAPTAIDLMRSRYSAYCVQNINYLLTTTHKSTRKYHDFEDLHDFSSQNKWVKLEILNYSETTVEFKAYYINKNKKTIIHHEKSTFIQENDTWFYIDGEWF